MDDSRKLIEQLELELLTPAVRSTAERLHALIAYDFVEIGSSGLTFDKVDVMVHLPNHRAGAGVVSIAAPAWPAAALLRPELAAAGH